MTLQRSDARRVLAGKEAGAIFTVLVVLWFGSRSSLDPLALLGLYIGAVALIALYVGLLTLS